MTSNILRLVFSYESFKKSELEIALEEHLTENSSRFASDSRVTPFYTSRAKSTGSPVKKDVDGPLEKLKVPRRRATKAVEEIVNNE